MRVSMRATWQSCIHAEHPHGRVRQLDEVTARCAVLQTGNSRRTLERMHLVWLIGAAGGSEGHSWDGLTKNNNWRINTATRYS